MKNNQQKKYLIYKTCSQTSWFQNNLKKHLSSLTSGQILMTRISLFLDTSKLINILVIVYCSQFLVFLTCKSPKWRVNILKCIGVLCLLIVNLFWLLTSDKPVCLTLPRGTFLPDRAGEYIDGILKTTRIFSTPTTNLPLTLL